MVEMIRNFGYFALFASVYFPLVFGYIMGGFDKVMDAIVPDPDASDFAKYGEAID